MFKSIISISYNINLFNIIKIMDLTITWYHLSCTTILGWYTTSFKWCICTIHVYQFLVYRYIHVITLAEDAFLDYYAPCWIIALLNESLLLMWMITLNKIQITIIIIDHVQKSWLEISVFHSPSFQSAFSKKIKPFKTIFLREIIIDINIFCEAYIICLDFLLNHHGCSQCCHMYKKWQRYTKYLIFSVLNRFNFFQS